MSFTTALATFISFMNVSVRPLVQHPLEQYYLKCIFPLGLTKKKEKQNLFSHWPGRKVECIKVAVCMSERNYLGVCLLEHFRHLEVSVCCTYCDVSVSGYSNVCSNLSACMTACTCTLWYLAQMTVVNCSSSGGLSILITAAKGRGNRSYLFHLQ